MSISAQQVVAPPVSDPNMVAETFVNGPINMNIIGSVAILTFTTVRLDAAQAFTGNKADFSAIVTSRLSMPVENLIQLRDMLAQAILKGPQMMAMPSGSPLKQ